MITISPLWFAFIIEVVLILSALLIVLYIRLRKIKTKLTRGDSEIAPEKSDQANTTPEPDLQHYLTTEIKLTRSRIDSLFADKDKVEFEMVEPDWLKLRESYLQLELELLADKTREDGFWKIYSDRIRRLLTACRLVKRLDLADIGAKPAEDEAKKDEGEISTILQEQAIELENLVNELNSAESEFDKETLQQRLDIVARKYREVYHCAFTVEDENKFLQDQIQALLVSESS